MNRLALLLILFLATSTFASTPPNPADYTVAMHVSSSQTQWSCLQAGCHSLLSITATIDGQNYLLQGNIRNGPSPAFSIGARKQDFDNNEGFLALGDYKAKVVPADPKDPQVPYYVIKSYQVLLPDGRLADFQVTGQTQ